VASPEKYVDSSNSSAPSVTNNLDDIVVSYEESQRLAQEKIDARMRLLALPPEEAQKIVDQTLYPQYWKFSSEDNIWSETIPTNYGEETDP